MRKRKVTVVDICVFTGGEFPPPRAAAHFFKAAPGYVVAADSGLDAAELYGEAFGFVVNEIVGDMDSLTDSMRRLAMFPPCSVHRYARDKDFTDTELAMQLAFDWCGGLVERILLVGGGGGRLDHLLALKELCGTEYAPDIWLCGEQVVFCLSDSRRSILELGNILSSDTISVFPCGGSVAGSGERPSVSSRGLFWPLQDVSWGDGKYSLSNRSTCQEPVVITVESGRFIVVAPLRAIPKLC